MIVQLSFDLDEIATEIHRVWADTRSHQIAAWDGYFLVGHLLTDARSRFRWDREYGQWREAQRFGFGATWSRHLRRIAEDEAAAREFLGISALMGKTPGVEAVIGHFQERDREAEREADRQRVALLAEPTVALAGERFATIVVDPPWSWEDAGDVDQMGRARPLYGAMPLHEIAALPIADHSADDAHLYLWITNRSLPKGFALMAEWGYRYVTCLTWCKPSIGIGNYFRNSTEHVLFGVRGSLPLIEHDQGTWFQAPRGPDGHSSKPSELYEIVRRVSPPPRLDWFGRREHDGFARFG
jgi:N6-adenosine-specific RNA methylase IME4